VISYQRSPSDGGDGSPPLPEVPLSKILSASFTSSSSAPARSTQLILADEVTCALDKLNHILSKAHVEVLPDVARSIDFSDRSLKGCEQAALRLVNQLCTLYAVASGHGEDETISNLTECMSVVVNHLRTVADTIAPTGYREISINLARDAFAAEPHVHKFFTYLLYAGREHGTQVFEGDSVISQLATRDNTANRSDRTVPATVPEHLLHCCPISDVKNGLLVPPGVPHRAVPSECPESLTEANLVIALLAFKPIGT
jgi:hypothetical protein